MFGRRFQPTRAGIVNLWDYRDEEFLFVNGWLVLRGPNGSGKTKALEVLFPFVLDGRIEPRRLNPFASEERTMKANLLYRGQEVSHAYVWMEFCSAGEDDAAGEYITIGIGLRAHRHVDRVTRWHFVVDGRVGEDFSIIDDDDRPLTRRDLIAEVGADNVHDGLEDYRRAVDARLFGLGPARYEQLLDLVLTLRKPQLAKDLNPVELSRTLQKGLRPLDEALMIEAASSFEDMESVAQTLEGLIAADGATASFLSVYSTYLRTHARAAADALTTRLAAMDQCRADVDGAIAGRVAADLSHIEAKQAVEEAEGEPGRLRAHLDSLKASAAYQSHQQLEDLRRHVADLADGAGRAGQTVATETSTVEERRADLASAEEEAEDAARSVHRISAQLSAEAEVAGIAWTASDADTDGVVERVRGRVEARREDVRVVRALMARLAQAERDHARSARDAASAQDATAAAIEAEEAAESLVSAQRGQVRTALTEWAAAHARLLTAMSAEQAPAILDAHVAELGLPPHRTLPEVLAEHCRAGVLQLTQQVAQAEHERAALADRRHKLVAERDRIAAARDDAPAPSPARPADREGRLGAPLWRLVDFAPGVKDTEAAAIEAALAAAGLLDAWIHPDPAQTKAALRNLEQDGYLVAVAESDRPTGRTLADVLVPEADAEVPADVVATVLACVGVRARVTPGGGPHSAISRTGQFGHGALVGALTKAAPEFIGATARARRRAARVAECERMIATLDQDLVALDGRMEQLRGTLAAYESAIRAMPSAEPIHLALRELDRAATTLRLRRETESAAVAALDQAVAEQAAAALGLRRAIGERSLPADRVDAVADAIGRFEAAGAALNPALRAAASASTAAAAAARRCVEAIRRLEHAQAAARDAARHYDEKHEAYRTLSDALGEGDVSQVVREVAATEEAITRSESALIERRERLLAAFGALQRADSTVESGQSALRIAQREAGTESVRLRAFAHADLLSLLRCRTDLRWPPHTPQDGGEIAAEVLALHEAILAATRELTPSENSLKQSATRLTTALTELQAQLPAAGLDHRPEFGTEDGIVVVRIADEQGITPVSVFAERIVREREDQQQLLSEAERRVFEDALLTQLARQIHHRTIEARDLVEKMDAQMRSRRMSSGLTVGVGWQLADDLEPGQREVCKLLEKDPARLGPTQLATLRRHFANRITAARAMTPEQPYRELLAEVLDYRRWRIFAFTLHRPGHSTENLTRSRHSQLSGGEQSVSLHLPLFAAANALFSSASPRAPRLLGMDEAFAGVDENGRGELMSLAIQFDLDLFMTGFDLWATHPAVPGCAHYDLSHSAVEHTAATVLIAWNGSVPTADFDGSLAQALGSPATRRTARRPVLAGTSPAASSETARFEPDTVSDIG